MRCILENSISRELVHYLKKKSITYNTEINIVGGIPDYNMIYSAIKLHAENNDALEEAIIRNNEFNFRTEKARKRFVAALYTAFINYKNDIHRQIVETLFVMDASLVTRQMLLFWQFSLTNQLFYELNRDVFTKNYFTGRLTLPRDEVEAYIREIISNNPDLKDKWSTLTIQTIASKYLTVLKKLDLLEGTTKKKFKYIQITNEALLVFIELVLSVETSLSNFFDSRYFSLIFMSKDDFLNRAKELALKEQIDMNFNGVNLKIESKNILLQWGR